MIWQTRSEHHSRLHRLRISRAVEFTLFEKPIIAQFNWLWCTKMLFFDARTSAAVDYTAYTSPCLPRVRIICTCAISVLHSVKKSKVSCFRNLIQQGQISAALINLYIVAAKPFYRKLLSPALPEGKTQGLLSDGRSSVRPPGHPSVHPA